MWVKHCHKPPITGNGKNTTYTYTYTTIYKNGDDWGMVYGISFTYIITHFPRLISSFPTLKRTNPSETRRESSSTAALGGDGVCGHKSLWERWKL